MTKTYTGVVYFGDPPLRDVWVQAPHKYGDDVVKYSSLDSLGYNPITNTLLYEVAAEVTMTMPSHSCSLLLYELQEATRDLQNI